MRIVVVFPWAQGSLSEDEEAHRRALARAAASPGTELDFVQIEQASMFSEAFSARNTSRVVDEIVQAIEQAMPGRTRSWSGAGSIPGSRWRGSGLRCR